jgi:hypothetical protein
MAVNFKTHLTSNLDIYTKRYYRMRVLEDPHITDMPKKIVSALLGVGWHHSQIGSRGELSFVFFYK